MYVCIFTIAHQSIYEISICHKLKSILNFSHHILLQFIFYGIKFTCRDVIHVHPLLFIKFIGIPNDIRNHLHGCSSVFKTYSLLSNLWVLPLSPDYYTISTAILTI